MTAELPTDKPTRSRRPLMMVVEVLVALVFISTFGFVVTRGHDIFRHADTSGPTTKHLNLNKASHLVVSGHSGARLLSVGFAGPTRVLSTERGTPRNAVWDVTSGSLLVSHGMDWSGIPDDGPASGRYTGRNGSAVFRALLRQETFGDVAIQIRVRPVRLFQTPRTPPVVWDGLTVFVRYHSQYALYAVSVARRDGEVVIKRKLPGGPANGGYYTTLDQARLPVRWGHWMTATVVIRDVSRHSVQIALWINGKLVMSTVDSNRGALTSPGRVGLRGDNCEFYLAKFEVSRWLP